MQESITSEFYERLDDGHWHCRSLPLYARFDGWMRARRECRPAPRGLVFLPCLMGATAPTWNESARGVFFGFTLAHSRDHFTRALLEGSAYAVRDITDQMQAMGLALTEMRVMGGGAKSRLWNQIKADVTGLPVAVPDTIVTTALGAALLALVGSGTYSSLVEACQQVVHIRERFEPQPAGQAVYAEMHALYRQTYFALQPVFERAAQIDFSGPP